MPSSDTYNGKFDVIVSFTTYGSRMQSSEIFLFLDSITSQECPGISYHVVVSLWEGDYARIPQNLSDYFKEHGIEVLLCKDDWKAHKKYISAMLKYKGIPIITVDDDAIYRKDTVLSLYLDSLNHPNTIICGRGREMKFDENGKTLPYEQWGLLKHTTPMIDIFPTGVGGVLYPPIFTNLVQDDIYNMILELDVIMNDDLILHYLAQENGIMAKMVECESQVDYKYGFCTPIDNLAHDDGALYKINVVEHLNNMSVHLYDKKMKEQPPKQVKKPTKPTKKPTRKPKKRTLKSLNSKYF